MIETILPPNDYLRVRNSKQLESVVKRNIDEKIVAHYLVVNQWDPVSVHFVDNIPIGSQKNIYVVDIFDIPNAMDTFRYCVKANKETISTTNLTFSAQLPVMVVIHKTFPRVVESNGAIESELKIS
tara:strand:+ start:470 stop:847 length:378 start_codon:yes stop_codon:yes gene_type:complete